MTISNHVLAGTVIALAVRQPLIALPLAFLSHFILDAIPHFGYDNAGFKEVFRHRLAYIVLGFDLIGVTLLLFTFVFINWVAFAAAAAALLPDTVWPYRYFYYERNGIRQGTNKLTRFHKEIQWRERPWGIVVELPLFVVGFIFLQNYVSG